MSSVTVESILSQVNQLPPSDRERLIEMLSEESEAKPELPPSRPVAPAIGVGDRTAEYKWLAKHRREYIGQWIALKGDQLIAHSHNAKEMFAQVDASGMEMPLVLYVEDPDVPFIGV